jgi:hypothetical protein
MAVRFSTQHADPGGYATLARQEVSDRVILAPLWITLRLLQLGPFCLYVIGWRPIGGLSHDC